MGWGWLCYAKNRRFVLAFPQFLGFLCLLDIKLGPLQNSHFATAPFFINTIYRTFKNLFQPFSTRPRISTASSIKGSVSVAI
jgi:hypothetical protein